MTRIGWAVPGALVALFGFGCGTFTGAATAWGAALGAGAVLSLALLADPGDPMRLRAPGASRFPSLLPWALVAMAAASALASPVPRAGRAALLLLPAYLLL